MRVFAAKILTSDFLTQSFGFFATGAEANICDVVVFLEFFINIFLQHWQFVVPVV